MEPVNPEDINRRKIWQLAKDHVIIYQALKLFASPNSPERDFEKALILMVMLLAKEINDLRKAYGDHLVNKTSQSITVNIENLSPELKKKILLTLSSNEE